MTISDNRTIHHHDRLIAIGASAGGVLAVRRILHSLGPGFRNPIAIVQHIPPVSRIDVALIYGNQVSQHVLEVEDKMTIEQGHIYMAAPDYHMLVEPDGSFSLSQDEPVFWSRPSIDVLFESVAHVYRENAIGILLTGANEDGARGMAELGRVGAITIVQDPKDAEVPQMPEAAIALRTPDHVLSIEGIIKFLSHFSENSTEATV